MFVSWKKIRTELGDFNSRPRIHLMHTHIVPDILSGIVVACIALLMAISMSFKRLTPYLNRPKNGNTEQAFHWFLEHHEFG
ncbi:MAG: hypothetical protein NPIRA06_15150 [Nitrospirales bacterium]|nr:MAG: hypothetical protein NPIRA06_15150 [Nitrospirales bacterium]